MNEKSPAVSPDNARALDDKSPRNKWEAVSLSQSIQVQLRIWVPVGLSWLIVETLKFDETWKNDYPSIIEDCLWKKSGAIQNDKSCLLLSALEKPRPFAYLILLLATLYGFVVHRKSPAKHYSFTYNLTYHITLCMRYFSSISDFMIYPPGYALLCKPIFLWFLVELGLWNWTYLGTVSDVYLDTHERTVLTAQGDPIHVFTSRKTGDPLEDAHYNPYSSRFFLRQDATARLFYIHLVDSALHVAWLRYKHSHSPHAVIASSGVLTNTEILTLCLFIELAIYTYARMRKHVVFIDDTETLIDVKRSVPMTKRSMLAGLFSRPCKQSSFRALRGKYQIRLFCLGMFAMATSASLPMNLWFLLGSSMVSITSMAILWTCSMGTESEEAIAGAITWLTHFWLLGILGGLPRTLRQ